MNRPIRFRAWNIDKMLTWEELSNKHPNAWPMETLMQFTGLRDKNGKEIYEGDIIEYEKQWWNSDELPANYKHREKVEWHNNASFAHFAAGDWTVEPEEVEIIGNIYENPKLLSNKI